MLRVGTDCSGMDAPIQALKNLGIPFIHCFSSDIDPYCIETIRANFDPQKIFTDITQRNMKDVSNIDLYVCGFPCQPFSQAGKRKGYSDNRGKIIDYCIEVIRKKRPKYYILENVVGLVRMKKLFEKILQDLQNIPHYSISWKILNTRDYGVPQNRERVYIVGRRGKIPFNWPAPTKMIPLKQIIDFTDREPDVATERLERNLAQLSDKSLFVNTSFLYYTKYPNSDKYCPCLTAESSIWCVPFHRRANVKEYLRLQGFPSNFKRVVSDTKMKKQIGNSMSVCVLEALLKELLYT
jgi:DNA (cytosine-5)-methyltransferase 1